MNQFVYFTASSLDGYIADANHSLDWLFQFAEPEGDYLAKFMQTIGAVVMGSATYEWLRRALEQAPEDAPPEAPPEARAWPYAQPCFVFSTRELSPFPGADLHFVRGPVQEHADAIRKAAGEGKVWIVGGGDLAGQFYDAGLLEEICVQIASCTLGRGAPVFPRRMTRPLQLEGARRIGPEFVELRYRVLPASPKN